MRVKGATHRRERHRRAARPPFAALAARSRERARRAAARTAAAVDEFRAFDFPFDHRVERFGEALQIVRRLLDGERVTFTGDYETVTGAVLLPTPSRRVPLMLGATGPRMLAASLPYVDAWNTWYDVYGNTPEGFAALNRRVDEAAQAAGRDPSEIVRSACVLVVLDGTAGGARSPRGWRPWRATSPLTCERWPRRAPTRRSSW
jgi:alkanesulfonate monooxygenase SsuD/methylene tetrahydromethanopterin reductase-like flavin-dependent oxidoreductase (luciferase family)